MDPRTISINAYDYPLPEERIASHPLAQRDDSKLLVYQQGRILTDQYKNIAGYLTEQSLLVFNNTRVVEARIIFQKDTGGQIELFCLEPHEQYGDITQAMMQKEKLWWKCLVGGASKWKKGLLLQKEIVKDDESLVLQAAFVEKRADYFIIEFSWKPGHYSFAEILHHFGQVPLPPYIKRAAEPEDHERYQTIYAAHDGSVAAPTAGLHFTDNLFQQFQNKNIDRDFVTLHVGAGTFKPVKSATLGDHSMHEEFIEVTTAFLKKLISHAHTMIIPVGTTSLRTLESLYWLGAKTFHHPEIALPSLTLHQWEVYENSEEDTSLSQALQALLQWMQQNGHETLITKTQLLIVPGYRFRVAQALVTNFHQPRSTLLLLVAALVGHSWKTIYQYALDHDFRFLSYGDGCLLFCD